MNIQGIGIQQEPNWKILYQKACTEICDSRVRINELERQVRQTAMGGACGVLGAEQVERDPDGKSAHEHGSKLDAGKELPFTVNQGFARAVHEVVRVGTFGAQKYTANGWLGVDNGVLRYANASERHREKIMIEGLLSINQKDGGVFHLAQKIWNDLATLELLLREQSNKASEPTASNTLTGFAGHTPDHLG